MGSRAPSTSAVHVKVTPSASLTPLGQATLPNCPSGTCNCLLIAFVILAGSTVSLPPSLMLGEQPASKAAASSSVMVVTRRLVRPPVAVNRSSAPGVDVRPAVAALRLVMAGTGKPPPAVQRGEGRAPRDMVCSAGWRGTSSGAGAAAPATSSDDAPCPTVGQRLPRVAVRSPRLGTLHPALPSRKRQTWSLSQHHRELANL